LTLEDDLAARLKAEARRTGRPFKALVNEALRAGLSHRRRSPSKPPFTIKPHDFGGLQPGISLDNIGELLERIEGPHNR
jgi:plasmid stability protein